MFLSQCHWPTQSHWEEEPLRGQNTRVLRTVCPEVGGELKQRPWAAGNEGPKAVRSGWLSSTGRNGFGKVPGIPLAPRAA